MDFDDFFREYWRKVISEGDNDLDKKAIARNAFAAGLEAAQHRVEPTSAGGQLPAVDTSEQVGLCAVCKRPISEHFGIGQYYFCNASPKSV